ncbi:hypothetical protein EV424DRAFT_1351921 [Suillus variegatus]|nr:hypothetical protein EV424DRAFT_1351921 [Suillus variegatus]
MYQPPNPETRDCRVSDIPSSEFRTPEPRNPRLPGLGYRVSGTRNSFRAPDTRTLKPETARSRVLDIPSSEFQTPDTRDPAVSGFGVRVSGTQNSDSGFQDSALPKPGG